MNDRTYPGATHIIRPAFAVILALGIALLALAGCTNGQQASSQQSSSAESTSASAVTLESLPATQDTDFGGILLGISIDDFNKSGFNFGDSVDIVFSNGYEMNDIPYFNGYYTNVGDPLLVGYPGTPQIKAAEDYGDDLWVKSGLAEGDTATITLHKAGEYLNIQEAFDISYTNERSDYSSDEVFANFRTFTGGSMKQGVAYRSASPIDNDYNRAAYVEKLMGDAGIAYVLNLSDSPAEADTFIDESESQGVDVSFFKTLRDADCVALLNLSASYPSDEFAQTLAKGLVDMSQHDGPYLVHCIEGKDRTGFVCILLEALCGATYDEMLADYMKTYDNYYGINPQSDPEKYDAISGLNFDGMLQYLANADDGADLAAIDYTEPARNYLRKGGMTDEQIDALVKRLT